MKILAKAIAILVPMAVACVCKWVCLLNWNEFSCEISLSAFSSKRVGMGGLSFQKVSTCAVYTIFIPSSYILFM